MKWLNGCRMMMVLIGIVAAFFVGGESARADFVFGTPIRLGPPINSPYGSGCPCISADGLSLYFNSNRSGASGICVATRETTDDEWSEPIILGLGPLAFAPRISADGLTLYFSSDQPGGYGGIDIYVTTRQTKDDNWGNAVNLGPPVNTSANEMYPSISADGLELYFSDFYTAMRPGGHGQQDLWVARRAARDEPWGEPMNLGPVVNSSTYDSRPYISPDGLLLFFDSARPGGYGASDLYVTRRATLSDPWETPVNLGPNINTSAGEESVTVSFDGTTLFYDNYTTRDIWQAPILPIADFNGDGIVDSADMCIMIDHWGDNYPLCDIGPMPWGDGIVDVQDLIVLAKHLFDDYHALAHWKLDEKAGNIAHDYVGGYYATLHGEPLWQPRGGQIVGALELDGIDDYISTDFILNPSQGAFSVLIWVKGGAPGQVIISQTDGAGLGVGNTWLGLDAQSGALVTGLVPPSVGGTAIKPLVSESIITDDQWHHAGFVWDGSYRILYVDGVEVAKDATAQKNPLKRADGGLHIGAGKTHAAGTFFSGLIDDIRIYNRVVSP